MLSLFHFSSQKMILFIIKYVGVLNKLNFILAFYHIQRLRDNTSILARICSRFGFLESLFGDDIYCFHDY